MQSASCFGRNAAHHHKLVVERVGMFMILLEGSNNGEFLCHHRPKLKEHLEDVRRCGKTMQDTASRGKMHENFWEFENARTPQSCHSGTGVSPKPKSKPRVHLRFRTCRC